MTRLSKEWKVLDEGGAVLSFTKDAWAVLQATAEERCIATDEMISVAIVRLVQGARYHVKK